MTASIAPDQGNNRWLMAAIERELKSRLKMAASHYT